MESRGVIHLSVRSLDAELSGSPKAAVAVPSNKVTSGRAFATVRSSSYPTPFSCLQSLFYAPSRRHAAAGRESGDVLSQPETEEVVEPKAGSGGAPPGLPGQAVGAHRETCLPSANLAHLSPPWLAWLTSLQLPQTWAWLHLCIFFFSLKCSSLFLNRNWWKLLLFLFFLSMNWSDDNRVSSKL